MLPVNSSQQEYCITNDGDVLLVGDSWKANACTSCTCNNGTIQCFSQSCPAANCRVPVLRKGQCCPHCLGECFSPSSKARAAFPQSGSETDATGGTGGSLRQSEAVRFSDAGNDRRQQQHSTKTFSQRPRIHTCFLSPAESAHNAFFMAAQEVESSVSAFPAEEHLSAAPIVPADARAAVVFVICSGKRACFSMIGSVRKLL